MVTIYPFAKPGRGFVYPDYDAKYPPSYDYRIKHYKLSLWLDIDDRSINGEAEIDLEITNEQTRWVSFDGMELVVDSVSGRPEVKDWRYDGNKLHIQVADKHPKLLIKYHAKPRKGLYFILPSKAHPNRPPQVWSQGETEHNRYWMPILDHPSIKCTFELIAYVPRGYTVISNGELLSVNNDDKWSVWHWRLDKPCSPYLFSIVVGVFDEIKEMYGKVKLGYYVPRGWKDKAHLSFSKTAKILEFYSNYLDYPYPYSKYDQVVVHEFIFGGMENVTATTLTDLTLHDEKAHMDYSSDPLVAHEAAHQWFGDLVTCKDWPHIWLNESMATLLENLFVRHDKGEQEFIYELIRDMDDYLNEYRDRYARPIVMRIYKYSNELFDSHSYPKGGLILNMLRSLLGEETFRKGLNKFLKKFEYGVADTEDFRKTMEEVSGKNLEWFFEQFFYNSGHPALKVEEEWKDESKKLLIRIKQVQGDDSLNTYILPLKIHIKIGETIKEYTIDLNEREAVYVFDLDARPDYVCVDPFFEAFKTIEYQRTAEQWAKILLSDKHVYCKVLAARALGSIGDLRAVEALSQAMLKDDFWGVAAEAAKALGEARTEIAREALLSALSSIKHPKVRRAICDALGNYRDDKVCDALKKVLAEVDESYYVRQSAAISLGKMRREEVYEYLLKFINEPSHNYAITIGVLRGLAEIGDERCLKTILEHSYEDKPTIVRSAAIMSLGKFPGRREVIKVLQDYSRDENYRVRQAVVAACKELMAPEVIPILEKMAESDLMEMVRRSARDAAEKIRKNLEKGVEYKALRDEIERIREENRRLVERISLLGRVTEHKG